MSYIGNQPTAGSYRKLTDISVGFNGSTTAFQLSVPPGTSNYYVTPLSPYQLLISVNNVLLNPGVDFTLNGSQIVFTTAPAGGVNFFGILMGDAVNIGAPASGTVTSSALSTDLTVVHNAGSVTTPSITTTGNLNTGVYFPSANNVAVTTNGTQRILFDGSGNTNVIGNLRLSGATSGYSGFKAASVAGSTIWTLPTADGTANQVLKTDGSGNLGWSSTSSFGDVFAASNNAFTGANTFTNTTGQTFLNAATQDGIVVKGRAGGTSSYLLSLQPTTLTASQTLTLPNATDTLIGKATTDVLTNKTYDTAGTGNVFKINGTQVSAITGTGSVVLASSPSLTTPTIGSAGANFSGSSSGTTALAASATASGTLTLPAATDTLIGKATTDTLTNKTYDTAGTGNSFKINGTSITAVTGSGSVVLSSSPSLVTPTIGSTGANFSGSTSGTTAVVASATASGTLTLPAATDTLIGKATTDTLTNKTYDTAGTGNSFKINGNSVNAVTGTGTAVVLATLPTFGATGINFTGSTSGTTTVLASATASGSLTLPAATDTLIGKATTDILTNKTYDTAGTGNVLKINGTQVSAVTGTGSVVLASSPSLTTPTIGSAGANFTGSTSGTTALAASATASGTLTLPAATDTLVGKATTDTLTNKTLSAEVYSTSASVTAGTNSQGQGALTSDYNVITTAASNPSGVTLPTPTTGRRVIVVNKGANAVNVYPSTGANIDALAANASISLPVNGWMEFNASSTTQWYSTFNITSAGTGVTTFSAGTTGLTPNTATSGAVTLAGTLAVANGGTGVTTNTGSGSVVLNNSPSLTTPTIGSGGALFSGSSSGSTTVAASATASGTLTLPAGTSTLAALAIAQSFSAAQRGTVSALTDGATITPDFSVANNYSVTLGGNRTLANPTNQTAGQSGIIVITQDSGGSRTLAYGSYYKFAGGTAPTLTTTANAVDVLAYYVESSTRITCKLLNDVK